MRTNGADSEGALACVAVKLQGPSVFWVLTGRVVGLSERESGIAIGAEMKFRGASTKLSKIGVHNDQMVWV
jgi:hypothetical protein